MWGDGIQYLAGGHARRQRFFWGKRRQGRLPARRQLPFDIQVPLLCQLWVCGAVTLQQLFPFFLLSRPVLTDFVEIPGDFWWDKKVSFWIPAEILLRFSKVFLTKRRAVHLGHVLAWAAKADMRAAGDQRRPLRLRLRRPEGDIYRLHIVPIDTLHVPTVSSKARRDVIAVSQISRPIYRDVVIVVEDDQPAQTQVPGQRGYLV